MLAMATLPVMHMSDAELLDEALADVASHFERARLKGDGHRWDLPKRIDWDRHLSILRELRSRLGNAADSWGPLGRVNA